MISQGFRTALSLGAVLLFSTGCKSGIPTTQFVNSGFNFAFVERVVVIPFENHTTDRLASPRATRLTMTEILATGSVDVVEPGAVTTAISQVTSTQPGRSVSLDSDQIIALGKSVNAQALILGSVSQSETLRSGAVGIPVVTLEMRMVETETGAVVWAASHSERGGSFSAKVLGTGGEPIAETTRRCVKETLRTLVN